MAHNRWRDENRQRFRDESDYGDDRGGYAGDYPRGSEYRNFRARQDVERGYGAEDVNYSSGAFDADYEPNQTGFRVGRGHFEGQAHGGGAPLDHRYGGSDWSENGYRSGRADRDYGNRSGRYGGRDDLPRPPRAVDWEGYGYSRNPPRHRAHDSDYDRERSWFDRASDEVSSWFGDQDAERRRRMDNYRGRGPKGYSRSDDRIREDISDRLTEDWAVDATDIEVSVSGGEVTLSGAIDSRTGKRRAEDIAESVSGVRNVQNNIRVQRITDFPDGRNSASPMEASSSNASPRKIA